MVEVRETVHGEVEVVPSGYLSREDVDELSKALEDALGRARGAIVLNFEALKSLNSSIIGKLLHFKSQCDQKGIKLSIRHCSAEMLQLLKMIRFDSLIQMES